MRLRYDQSEDNQGRQEISHTVQTAKRYRISVALLTRTSSHTAPWFGIVSSLRNRDARARATHTRRDASTASANEVDPTTTQPNCRCVELAYNKRCDSVRPLMCNACIECVLPVWASCWCRQSRGVWPAMVASSMVSKGRGETREVWQGLSLSVRADQTLLRHDHSQRCRVSFGTVVLQPKDLRPHGVGQQSDVELDWAV